MRIVRVLLPWVIFLAAGYLAYKFILPLFKPDEEEMDVQKASVRRGDLRQVVPADGVVTPAVLVEVKSKASEVVEKVLVEPGDVVTAGQVLVELGKKEITQRLEQAQADLESAKASLELSRRSLSPQQKAANESNVRSAQINFDDAQQKYDRVKELHTKGYATDAELTDAQTALDSARENLEQARNQQELDLAGAQPEEVAIAKASVTRAQSEVDQLTEQLGNTTIRAPLAGTVLTRPVEIGTAVASGTSGNTGGTVVATIGDLASLYVKANIEETDLGRVKLGTACRITFDAYSGWVWSGKVKKIYPQGSTENGQQGGGGGVQFPVDIAIDLKSARQEESDGGGMGMGGWPGGGGGGRGGGGGGGGMRRRGGGGGGGRAAAPPAGESKGAGGSAEKPEKAEKLEIPSLLPQMTASVEIVLEDHPDVVIIQAQFIKYDDEGKAYCEVIKPDEAKKEADKKGASKGGASAVKKIEDEKKALREMPREHRELVLGFSDGTRTEVVSGLEEGETVITERPIKKDNF